MCCAGLCGFAPSSGVVLGHLAATSVLLSSPAHVQGAACLPGCPSVPSQMFSATQERFGARRPPCGAITALPSALRHPQPGTRMLQDKAEIPQGWQKAAKNNAGKPLLPHGTGEAPQVGLSLFPTACETPARVRLVRPPTPPRKSQKSRTPQTPPGWDHPASFILGCCLLPPAQPLGLLEVRGGSERSGRRASHGCFCRGPEPLTNLRNPLLEAMSFKNKIALLPRSEQGPCAQGVTEHPGEMAESHRSALPPLGVGHVKLHGARPL